MLDAIRQDYVRTARAKGASERTVIWKHVLKNALLPVITQVGMSLGLLLCGAVVAEELFSVQGIGSLIVERITYKDEPVIIAGTILISICFTVVMLVVDLIYAMIDPQAFAPNTQNWEEWSKWRAQKNLKDTTKVTGNGKRYGADSKRIREP